MIRFITKWQPHVTGIRKRGCQGFIYLTLTANYPGLLPRGQGTGNDEGQRPEGLNNAFLSHVLHEIQLVSEISTNTELYVSQGRENGIGPTTGSQKFIH